MLRKRLRPSRVAFSELEPRVRESSRKLSLFQERTRGGEENADVTATDSLQRLHSLSRNFSVWLDFTEPFARGVKSDKVSVPEGLQIGEPAFGAGDAFSDNDEKTARAGMRERGYRDRVAGTWEAGCV